MTSIYQVGAFWLISLAIIFAAIMVVASRQLVHMVLWLAVCFIAVASMYFLLDADYLALVQIMVYAGAVSIMMIFGVMLTQRPDLKECLLFNNQLKLATLVVIVVLALTGGLTYGARWFVSGATVPADTIAHIGTLLLSKYVIPFEVAAVLLLVALIGAIVLAKEVKPGARSRD
ncbi:MAG: NADH-quinone oxidoreductase subunit J [Peptococcaceae bacterium]|nr:NADH-quinone oxidoreductase subunit J [Peptococcaceae bacterium]